MRGVLPGGPVANTGSESEHAAYPRARIASGAALILVFAMLLSGGAGESAPAEPAGFKVTHSARSLQPGEVVLITLESPDPLRDARCVAFGKTFPLFAGENPVEWRGLIGIDLDTPSGRHSVLLRGARANGTSFQTAYELNIRDKKFATRRLTVDERYVTPPRDVEERIRRESKRVEAIFATVAPRRIWQGRFVVPVPAPANSSFGRRSILNGKPRSPHAGTDFSAEAGTPVHAPNAGIVVLADDLYYSGITVIIDHGQGLYSYFAHMSSLAVHEGDRLETGTVVGRVGSTGRSTGPHLHWTVRLVGTRVDPLSLVKVAN